MLRQHDGTSETEEVSSSDTFASKKKILIHMTILKPDRVGQLGVDGRSPPGSLKQYNNIMTVQEVILYRSLQYSTTRCRP